jgi:hypothetical protein
MDALVPLREWRFEWFREERSRSWLDFILRGWRWLGRGGGAFPFVIVLGGVVLIFMCAI